MVCDCGISWSDSFALWYSYLYYFLFGSRALVLMNLLNWLRKSDKMLDKSRILSLFLNSFNKSNKCKVLYVFLCLGCVCLMSLLIAYMGWLVIL